MSTVKENIGQAVFPTDPDKRFETLCYTFFNAEPKCVAMLLLEEEPKTLMDAYDEFLEVTREVWVPNSKESFLRGCYGRFWADTGLVSKDVSISTRISRKGAKDRDAYKATEDGIQFGHPLAAFLLERSLTFPFSLGALGSSRRAGATNGVCERMRILKILADNPSILKDVDAAKEIYLDKVSDKLPIVVKHLRMLDGSGLINYRPKGRKDTAAFVLSPIVDKPDIRPLHPLEQTVINLLFRMRIVDTFTISRMLREKFYYLGPEVIDDGVRRALDSLLVDGICHFDVDESGLEEGEVRVTNRGKRFLKEIVMPIKKALNGNNKLLDSWSKIDWRRSAPRAVEKFANY